MCHQLFLAALLDVTGDRAAAKEYRTKASQILTAVQLRLWSPEQGFYVQPYLNGSFPQVTTRVVVPGPRVFPHSILFLVEQNMLGPDGFIPLWAGMATPQQAAAIKKHLMNPEEFNT